VSERARTAQLDQAAREQASQVQARVEWLQNQWDVTKAKVEELNQSSHHWWTVADRSSHELEKVYASLSWRLTTPLRWLKFQLRRLLHPTTGVESRPSIVQSKNSSPLDPPNRPHLPHNLQTPQEGLLSIDELMRRVLKEAGKST
jgi:hypothetical protein